MNSKSLVEQAEFAPHGFLLVWADDEALQNGSGTNGDLHAAFKLGTGGEELGLYAPDGTLQPFENDKDDLRCSLLRLL